MNKRQQIKDEFLQKWNKIEKDIPEDFLEKALSRRPSGTKPNRIINVRYGRTYDLEILDELERLIK